MLKTSIFKFKRAWTIAHGPRCRYNSKALTGRHRTSILVLRRAEKSTKAGKEIECARCKQLIEFVFGPPNTMNRPFRIFKTKHIDETDQGTTESQLDYTSQSNCIICKSIISKAFGTDENGNPMGIPKAITKIPIKEAHILNSTTAKETEEQLTQKIEVIDETPLVEAGKQNIDGFNVTPRVIGHLAQMNIIKTIEFISNKNHDISIANFSTDNSGCNKSTDGTGDINPFELVAKRCLALPPDQIDDYLKNQTKLGGDKKSCKVDTNKQKSFGNSDVSKTSKSNVVDTHSTVIPNNDLYQTNINPYQEYKAGISSNIQSQAGLDSKIQVQTPIIQMSGTYPTKEEILRGLPDPQSFYAGFKPEEWGGKETDNHKYSQYNYNQMSNTVNQHFMDPSQQQHQQSYFYSNNSYDTYPMQPVSSGFYNQEGVWLPPTEQTENKHPSDNKHELSDQKTIHVDEKTPSRAIEGRPSINRFQETILPTDHEIKTPSQKFLPPEYICPAPRTQAMEHETGSKYLPNEVFAPTRLSKDQFKEKQTIREHTRKKEIAQGLVHEESFCTTSKIETNKKRLNLAQSVHYYSRNQHSIIPDEKTPLRAIEAKPQVEAKDISPIELYSSICPSVQLKPKVKEASLSKTLIRKKQRVAPQKVQKKVDPIKGKCRKRKPPPPCPPPPPPCPPPARCPPRPCPPRKPPCPKPCVPKCPRPCYPPPPNCDPRNNPCKFKKIYQNESIYKIATHLTSFTSLLPSTYSMPLINYQFNSAFSTNAFTTNLQSGYRDFVPSSFSADFGYQALIENASLKSETIILARTFDPWVPIPSWPVPKKIDRKPFTCPKEGCRPTPPPRLETPCNPPCRAGNPCTTFPKRRS